MPKSAVQLTGAGHLSWYRASDKARCGSRLFWEPLHTDYTLVALGALDGPTGARLRQHIFAADKGDYYDIADGLPQHDQ